MQARQAFVLAKTVLLATVTVLLGACASSTVAPVSSYEIGERPELGVRTAVDVGDVLYSKFDYLEKSGARLTSGYDAKFLLGRVVAPAGTFLQEQAADGGQSEFCSTEPLYSGPATPEYVCFRDSRGSGVFDLIRVTNLKFGQWTVLDEQKPTYRPDSDSEADGFRKELIYQGVSGDVIRLSYREFVDDFARPAFTQEVTYNLEPEGATELRFQGAVIEVYEASNNRLDYQVVEGFRD